MPYVYVLYSHDADIGGTAPKWSTPERACRIPADSAGPTADGCVISARLSRLTASGNVATGGETVLVENWFQQYPSHSIGSWCSVRTGCSTPAAATAPATTSSTTGRTATHSTPAAIRRSASAACRLLQRLKAERCVRRTSVPSGDPVTLDGTVIRVDPLSGAGPPTIR